MPAVTRIGDSEAAHCTGKVRAGGSSNAPTITNTLASHDLFGFYTHDGGSTIYSFKLGQDLK